MGAIFDPLNNTAFDIHEYLDSDFSGGHIACASLASTYLAPLTAWLQEYGYKAMITEFGGANGTQCAPYISDIVDYMAANDVYIGWTAWAAGPFWGTNSACCSGSDQLGSLEPGSLASDGSPGMYTTVWLDEIQPLLPTTLQKTGLSNINGPAGAGGSTGSSSSSSKLSTSTKATSSSSKLSTSTMKSATASTSSAAAGVALYGQCGGNDYAGSTTCASGTCTYYNAWYSQCVP